MISITEIVLIVAGFAAIILGYLLPAGKKLDEEDKMLMEREIRELVRREVEDDLCRCVVELDSLELVYEKEVPVFEKYDEYVPPELIRKGFACGVLDVEGMRRRVLGWRKNLTLPS